jgi:hypothetical protein
LYRDSTPGAAEFANSLIAFSAAELDNMNKREKKTYLLQKLSTALRTPHACGRTTWRFPVTNGKSTVLVCRKALQKCFFITRYYAQELMRLVSNFVSVYFKHFDVYSYLTGETLRYNRRADNQ